jgi:hypothetical protein
LQDKVSNFVDVWIDFRKWIYDKVESAVESIKQDFEVAEWWVAIDDIESKKSDLLQAHTEKSVELGIYDDVFDPVEHRKNDVDRGL